MPVVETDVQVYCGKCWDGLCSQTESKKDRHGNPELHVTPCEDCLAEARAEGYEEGYAEAEKKFNVG